MRSHYHAAAHSRDYKFGFITGTTLLPSHMQRQMVLEPLWMDTLCMNNTVLSVRLGKIYTIQSMLYFLFLLLEGIQTRSSMGSYTLKCCWDHCDSATRSKTTEVCIKKAVNIFNCFL